MSCTVPVVDRFLAAICAGEPLAGSDLYIPDAILDAVVPGWRFSVSGATAVVAEYDRWFGARGTLDELHRQPTPDGEVIEYTLQWEENGVPHGARHVHLLSIDRQADRIAADHVWCGGRWPADLLAQMGAAASVAGAGVERVMGVETAPALTPRPVLSSLEELLADADHRAPVLSADDACCVAEGIDASSDSVAAASAAHNCALWTSTVSETR